MRIAVIYNKNNVYVEFEPKKFREIFKRYFNGDVDEAFDKIEEELKKEILNK